MRANSRIILAGSLLFGLFGFAAVAAAQTPPVQEQQRPGEGLRNAERSESAFEASERLRALEPGEKVTYADILAHPDDIDLNYRYAQSQVRDGELRGAAATLERILLIAPELARVRLLYAVVLYRLDNLSEAEREFRAVSGLPMADTLRAEVEYYLEQIALRRKPTRYTATLAGGMQWDSNRNAGPDGGQVLFLDTPFDLVEGKKQGDFSGVMLGALRAQHDLGYDAGHSLVGGLQVYGQKQIDLTDLDLMAIAGEAGGIYRSPWVDVEPRIFATYLNLGGESYVSAVGTGVRANHRFSKQLDLFARFRFDYEFFESLERSPITDERTGARVQGGVGASWTPLPMLRFDAGVGAVHKAADQDFYAYTGPLAFLSGTWLLPGGQFLLSTFSYEYDGYQGPEPIVSPQTRRDDIYIGGLTYGAPLGLLMPFLARSAAFRDTLLTVNATYLSEVSTVENYTYDDLRFTVMYTRSFQF